MKNEQKVVVFINWSDEHFTGYWDSVAYQFPPGAKMYMESWKAEHFAKHLANRELLRNGFDNDTSPRIKLNGRTDNVRFNEYFDRAIIDTGHSVDESRAVTDALNLNMSESDDADDTADNTVEEKPVRPASKKKPARKVKKVEKATTEDEFEGLKD